MCMYIYMYIYICIFTHIHMDIRTHISVSRGVCLSVGLSICIHVCLATPTKRHEVPTSVKDHHAANAQQATESSDFGRTLSSSSWRRPPGDTKCQLLSKLSTLSTPTKRHRVPSFCQRSTYAQLIKLATATRRHKVLTCVKSPHVGDAHQTTESSDFWATLGSSRWRRSPSDTK